MSWLDKIPYIKGRNKTKDKDSSHRKRLQARQLHIRERVSTPYGQARIHKIYPEYCIVKLNGEKKRVIKEDIKKQSEVNNDENT